VFFVRRSASQKQKKTGGRRGIGFKTLNKPNPKFFQHLPRGHYKIGVFVTPPQRERERERERERINAKEEEEEERC